MKILVRLADPMLMRALVELLRAKGHDICPASAVGDGYDLRIQSDTVKIEPPAGVATLILRRGGEQPSDADPAAALRSALRGGGVATWPAPLDVRLLLDVIRSDTPPDAQPFEANSPHEVPDLSRASHAWMVVDVHANTVLLSNAEARALLDLPEPVTGVSLADVPIAGDVREAVREQSEGFRAGEVAGVQRTATWWTDAHGHRIVCFLEAPILQTPAARNRQSLAELGEMAATLAHEIRNPVASLAGALDLLEDEGDPVDRAEILGMARERLKQLSRLLEKTLNLARPIGGPTEVVEIGAVIASAVSTLALDPRFANVEMAIHGEVDGVPVRTYSGPLLQALTNLLLNAGQAMDGNGRIDISLTVDSRRAFLRIQDQGPGIPEGKRQEIFRPFYTTKPSGTGLGLAEVRRAMQAFGGAVEIEDVPTGACVRLEVPLAHDSHTSTGMGDPEGGERSSP